MLARGGQTKGVASASSDVAGASNARAENSADAREPPAAARRFSDQSPSYAPPHPSEALQADGSSDRGPSSRRSRSPRARRSCPSEMWSNALYEAKREFMKEFYEATAGIRRGAYFPRGRWLRRAKQIMEQWMENKESEESDSVDDVPWID